MGGRNHFSKFKITFLACSFSHINSFIFEHVVKYVVLMFSEQSPNIVTSL
jgi:hypothetical protein